jgi:nifR3 family TIM-barrel protein
MSKNFWQKLDKPIIGLAPMAGITDSPFRKIAKEWGAELVYSEMISSHGLIYRDKKSFELAYFRKMERPIIIQLFGREPSIMAEAARIIEKEIKADGVDINFGCPAKRVVKSGHGAALMDEPELAGKIVRAMVKAIEIPLSVKTRLGEKKKTEIYDFAKRMEATGAKAIAIHGRTLKQGYKGAADWKPIYKVAEMVEIPVLGNGDIKSQKDIAQRLTEGKLSGVLIGRGAFGNPFIFHGVRVIKKDPERFIKNEGFEFAAMSSKERIETMLNQANYALETKGERGLIELRKHLAAYVKGNKKAKEIRSKLVQTSTIKEIEKVLKKYENYL